MYAEERRRQIASLTAVEGRVNVTELSAKFNVTAETIRRDLAVLDREGVVHRVHGGAVASQSFQTAEFTLDEDGTTYDLSGQSGPLMEIMRVLHANHVPVAGAIDIRSNPVVRQQVMDIVRRSATAPPPAPVMFTPAPLTVSQRLQELDTLHATGSITEAEYTTKRQEILSEL